ncbi:hypothetical protein EDB85DRAFT_1900029 [Lactarius pseudohatsudake]|nr:hypothetical protein EDB85DRAFT_1900029 [Lactarius pseudohatsudake]
MSVATFGDIMPDISLPSRAHAAHTSISRGNRGIDPLDDSGKGIHQALRACRMPVSLVPVFRPKCGKDDVISPGDAGTGVYNLTARDMTYGPFACIRRRSQIGAEPGTGTGDLSEVARGNKVLAPLDDSGLKEHRQRSALAVLAGMKAPPSGSRRSFPFLSVDPHRFPSQVGLRPPGVRFQTPLEKDLPLPPDRRGTASHDHRSANTTLAATAPAIDTSSNTVGSPNLSAHSCACQCSQDTADGVTPLPWHSTCHRQRRSCCPTWSLNYATATSTPRKLITAIQPQQDQRIHASLQATKTIGRRRCVHNGEAMTTARRHRDINDDNHGGATTGRCGNGNEGAERAAGTAEQ